MIEVHAEIIRTHLRRGQRGPELVQSTDQAVHHQLQIPAGVIATVAVAELLARGAGGR